jgi:hypothetical protein
VGIAFQALFGPQPHPTSEGSGSQGYKKRSLNHTRGLGSERLTGQEWHARCRALGSSFRPLRRVRVNILAPVAWHGQRHLFSAALRDQYAAKARPGRALERVLFSSGTFTP